MSRGLTPRRVRTSPVGFRASTSTRVSIGRPAGSGHVWGSDPGTWPDWAGDRSRGGGARKKQGMHDVDGLNAGYAKALLEEYLENPDAVPEEWRRLFESGSSELVTTHPGLARLLEALREDGNGHRAAPPVPAPPAPPPAAERPAPPPAPAQPARPDPEFLRAVAAATELVGAYRSFGHLAARLDRKSTRLNSSH